jgi:NADPH-dependent ferric siderophore reductase
MNNVAVPTLPGGDPKPADLLARAPELGHLRLRVAEVTDITARTRRIRLTGPGLDRFSYRPGQDLMVLVDTSAGRRIFRRYTVRRHGPAESVLDLHVATNTDGPGAGWARALRVDDQVEAIGPRGKITLVPHADWHLFVGDDVAVPAMAAMVEGLPAGARAIVLAEVAAGDEEVPVEPADDVELSWVWLRRDGRPAGEPDALLAAMADAALPDGRGQAYVAGEARVVSDLRAALVDRGFRAETVAAKAYWGRGRSNASHGELLKDRPTS